MTLHQPFLWSLGSIQFNLPQPVAQDEILYTKALLHESDTTLKPLKEICHQFRAPEPRPPVVVSLSFAAAVAVRARNTIAQPHAFIQTRVLSFFRPPLLHGYHP